MNLLDLSPFVSWFTISNIPQMCLISTQHYNYYGEKEIKRKDAEEESWIPSCLLFVTKSLSVFVKIPLIVYICWTANLQEVFFTVFLF